ncbi:hypothetical protein DL96DRAFT_1704444 [Flagelloscypha sp. PMI_526]|nr:hypothetical protein DL96DRAFT_1704444 [Flagelloscypha sp. PMI_526]
MSTGSSVKMLNFAFQLVGLIAAIIFGIWSVRAYDASVEANRLSTQSLNAAATANELSILASQLSFYSFCSQSDANLNMQDATLNATCAMVRATFDPLSIACTLYGIDKNSCKTPSSPLPPATITGGFPPLATPTTATYMAPGPTTSAVAGPPHSSSSPHPLSLGLIIGIVAGGVAVLGALFYFFVLRKADEQPPLYNSEKPDDE